VPLGSPSPRSPLVLALVLNSPLQADDLFLDSDTLANAHHGLRAVYSPAIRSPDPFENNVNRSYRVTHQPPGAFGQSSVRYFGNLDQAHMCSCERGYKGYTTTTTSVR
jgi:hypothetical protein